MKQLRIAFGILLIIFFSSAVLEATYLLTDSGFPILIAVSSDKDEKEDHLLQQTLRGTILLCLGTYIMTMGYEKIKKNHVSIKMLPNVALLCAGGLLFTRGAALVKRILINQK